MSNETKGLEVHPEIRRLITECEVLTEELTGLICERDHLMNVVGPNLEADYHIKVGVKEYQVFSLQCTVRRLRRKIELIQAEINRGHYVIESESIEKQLDEEFNRWEQEMYDFFERLKHSRYRLNSLLNLSESLEIRRIYRLLAASLHPDVNPDYNENEKIKNLWLRVQDAYARGDLEEMKTLQLLSQDLDSRCEVFVLNSYEQLGNRQQDLIKKIAYYIRQINYIKQEFPFNVAEKLQNPAWVKEQHQKADKMLKELEEQKDFLGRVIRDLFSESDQYVEVH